jgi:choline dehydrogenase-like flavoprotein
VKYPPSAVVDFVIVGSGAAGGVLAKELSVAGFAVVVRRRGRACAAVPARRVQVPLPERDRVQDAGHVARDREAGGAPGALQRRGAARDLGGAGRGREQRPLHRQLLALPSHRLHRAQQAGGDSRRIARGLADHLRRPRAVLHEGRLGSWRLGGGGGVGRAAPLAPLPVRRSGEVGGRLFERAAEEAGVASIPCADGDSLAAAQRTWRVPELRLLHGLWLRVRREELHAGVDDPDRRAHGGVRGAGQAVTCARWSWTRRGAPRG